jgi:tetratricopeptide (TPR) repeat protein
MRTGPRIAAALIAIISVARTAVAQDPLAHAKDLYASAAYEEALAVLEAMPQGSSAIQGIEVAGYRVFCLFALGRSDEARRAIETLVQENPLYHPSETAASPRLRTFFEDVRRPLLPAIVQRSYGEAKAAFDRKEWDTAAAAFDRVLALVDEPGVADQQGVADMRTLAEGFRDLSRANVVPPAPPAASSPAPPAAPPVASAPRTYDATDNSVTHPVVIKQTMPTWRPPTPGDGRREFLGVLELMIDEEGTVTSAVMRKPAHPMYDGILMEAARTWKYRPATKGGAPVRYKHLVEVRLTPIT